MMVTMVLTLAITTRMMMITMVMNHTMMMMNH